MLVLSLEVGYPKDPHPIYLHVLVSHLRYLLNKAFTTQETTLTIVLSVSLIMAIMAYLNR